MKKLFFFLGVFCSVLMLYATAVLADDDLDFGGTAADPYPVTELGAGMEAAPDWTAPDLLEFGQLGYVGGSGGQYEPPPMRYHASIHSDDLADTVPDYALSGGDGTLA